MRMLLLCRRSVHGCCSEPRTCPWAPGRLPLWQGHLVVSAAHSLAAVTVCLCQWPLCFEHHMSCECSKSNAAGDCMSTRMWQQACSLRDLRTSLTHALLCHLQDLRPGPAAGCSVGVQYLCLCVWLGPSVPPDLHEAAEPQLGGCGSHVDHWLSTQALPAQRWREHHRCARGVQDCQGGSDTQEGAH